jgi:hypothetical protein
VFAPASPDQARVVPKTRVAAAGKAVESGEPADPENPSRAPPQADLLF